MDVRLLRPLESSRSEDRLRGPFDDCYSAPVGPADGGSFRQAVRLLAAGVTVVATGTRPHRAGMTATAVCSLTAEPPQILSCLNADSGTCAAVLEQGRFSVNVLDDGHVELARRFAGMCGSQTGEDRFAGTWLSGSLEVPVLTPAVAALECKLKGAQRIDSHFVLVGLVRQVWFAGTNSALIYRDGQFGTWVPLSG